MRNYVKKMIDEFPINIEKSRAVARPATKNIFKVNGRNTLNKNKVELFHTTVDRDFFLCKRYRTDIHPTIAVLCTRVKQTNRVYWNKLLRLMKYIVGTQELCLTLNAETHFSKMLCICGIHGTFGF